MERDIGLKLDQFKKGEVETLRISSTYLPANFLLPVWLAAFKKKFPLVHVDLHSGNSHQVIEKLLHYKTDLAFVVKERWNEPDVKLHHVMDMEFWFIVPPGHKYDGKVVLLSELVREPFILREEGSSTREMLFSLCKIHGVSAPETGLQFHGLTESIRFVMAGYGTMLAPALPVQDYLKRGEVGRVRVKGVEITRPIYLCTRKRDKELSLPARNFMDTLPHEKKASLI